MGQIEDVIRKWMKVNYATNSPLLVTNDDVNYIPILPFDSARELANYMEGKVLLPTANEYIEIYNSKDKET